MKIGQKNSFGGVSRNFIPCEPSQEAHAKWESDPKLTEKQEIVNKASIKQSNPFHLEQLFKVIESPKIKYTSMASYIQILQDKGQVFRIKDQYGANEAGNKVSLFVSRKYFEANPNMPEVYNDPRQPLNGEQPSLFDQNSSSE